jgi:hypothetical protein
MIEGKLIFHPQKDQTGADYANSQSKNIQKAVPFVFPKVSECGFEKLVEHRFIF